MNNIKGFIRLSVSAPSLCLLRAATTEVGVLCRTSTFYYQNVSLSSWMCECRRNKPEFLGKTDSRNNSTPDQQQSFQLLYNLQLFVPLKTKKEIIFAYPWFFFFILLLISWKPFKVKGLECYKQTYWVSRRRVQFSNIGATLVATYEVTHYITLPTNYYRAADIHFCLSQGAEWRSARSRSSRQHKRKYKRVLPQNTLSAHLRRQFQTKSR